MFPDLLNILCSKKYILKVGDEAGVWEITVIYALLIFVGTKSLQAKGSSCFNGLQKPGRNHTVFPTFFIKI